MTIDETNRLKAIIKNVTNIATLLEELLTPIEELMEKKHYATHEDAVKVKLSAEEYLKKYGVFTLNAAIKAVDYMTKEIPRTVGVES